MKNVVFKPNTQKDIRIQSSFKVKLKSEKKKKKKFITLFAFLLEKKSTKISFISQGEYVSFCSKRYQQTR